MSLQKAPDTMTDDDVMMRRLRYRAHYRGMREMDRILDAFLNAYGAKLTCDDMMILDALLQESDPELCAWLQNPKSAPKDYQSLIVRIQGCCA